MATQEIIETTLGDLIVALTDETAPYVRNKNDVFKVVAFTLAHLLSDSGVGSRSSQYWQ